VSMSAGTDVRVTTVPVLSLVAEDLVCSAAVVLVQLKQYSVPAVKSPLWKPTVWPEIVKSPLPVGEPILVQALAPDGQPVVVAVLTVQSPTVVLTVYPVGNVTLTPASVAVEVGLAQTVPDVKVDAIIRSNLTRVWVIAAADECRTKTGTNTWANNRNTSNPADNRPFVVFIFNIFIISYGYFNLSYPLLCLRIKSLSILF
jgi:hypothetical protein